jgi:hypothetical protein
MSASSTTGVRITLQPVTIDGNFRVMVIAQDQDQNRTNVYIVNSLDGVEHVLRNEYSNLSDLGFSLGHISDN